MAIVADFASGQTVIYTKSAYQFDKGQKLIVTGIDLPETYEIHISNSKDGGVASAYAGNPDGVLIPDVYFTSGDYIYVWLYVTSEETIIVNSDDSQDENEEPSNPGEMTVQSGTTTYEIRIPIVKRAASLPINMT